MGCVFLFFFCHYLIFSSPPPPLWCLQSCARLAEERGGVRESGPKRSEGRVKQKQGEAGGGGEREKKNKKNSWVTGMRLQPGQHFLWLQVWVCVCLSV